MSIPENALRPRWSLASIAAAFRAHRTGWLLHDLSDRQLEDIGLSRSDVRRMILGH